jgi:hypothetical protein
MDIDVQTFYSTVNNSMSNVVHNRISSTEFKLPMCRNNLMSCSSSIPIDVEIFFIFSICGRDVDNYNFCFTTELQLCFDQYLKF